MKLQLLAAGTRAPSWVSEGFTEYQRRLPAECRLELNEITPANRNKFSGASAAMADEEKRFRRNLHRDAHIVTLDREGASWTTEKLASRFEDWLQRFPLVQLLIGGPDGLAPELRAQADERWSLSALTLPHFMVRVVVAEQLYRAWSLLNNHPYHR